MAYFVTGATGFIGRHLVQELLDNRDGEIFVLVRAGSKERIDRLLRSWGPPGEPRDRRPGQAAARASTKKWVEAHRGGDRPLLPRRGDLRHDRLRRAQRAAQRRRHARCGRLAGALDAGGLPPGLLDRGVRRLPRHVRRDDVRRGAGAAVRTTARSSSPSGSSARSAPVAGGSTGRRSWSATPRPERWTRSTGPTTSSRCSSGCATRCPPGCRSSASTSATPTWCRSTTSPRRWSTSPTAGARRPGLPPGQPRAAAPSSTWSTRSPWPPRRRSSRSRWTAGHRGAADQRAAAGAAASGLVQNVLRTAPGAAGASRDHRPARIPPEVLEHVFVPDGVRLPPHGAAPSRGPGLCPDQRGTPRRCGPTGRSTSTGTPPATAAWSTSSATGPW